MQLRLPLAWLISRLWLTNNEPPICIMWPWILRQDLWPFAFQRKNQYRQCATFSTALCICRRHCAVYGRKVGKIICCLRLPQFAAQQQVGVIISSCGLFACGFPYFESLKRSSFHQFTAASFLGVRIIISVIFNLSK